MTKNTIWGGRFDKSPAGLMQEINASIGFDKRLHRQDIAGSIAHAKMLAAQGIITTENARSIVGGLERIREEIEAGHFQFKIELEDIHMNIEARLKEIVGASDAGRLHTARSRNDQVAVDFKMFVRRACEELAEQLAEMQKALLNLAKDHIETVMPGFTHLQVAQPISFAFYLQAYYEMLKRDRRRLANAVELMDECPLGAAALAGTPYPIDRDATAGELGFKAPTKNALDSVSDRDFALEYLSCAAIAAMHLSRLAEEMIVFSSQPFGFIKVPEEYASGSSIMPQKRNPDAAELIRAKTGRIYGDLLGLLTVMKGLPLAYSKDMQEDKERLFDAYDAIMLAAGAMTEMVKGLEVNKPAMRKALEKGYPTATDLADWLVKNAGISFRDAHHISGAIVKLAEGRGLALSEVPLADMQTVCPEITADIFPAIDVMTSLNARTSFGGTAPLMVRQAIELELSELG